MRKKRLAMLAPLLAMAAFAAAPAMAQAETKEYGTCPVKAAGNFELTSNGFCVKAVGGAGTGTHEFMPFANATNVESKGTTAFTLENVAKTADIECTTLTDSGTMENVAGVGMSNLTLTFSGCKGSGVLAGCVAPSNGTGIISGTVTDKVIKEREVEVTIMGGFEVVCPAPIGNLGDVTGKATGTLTSGNVLTFTKAPGLTFAGEAATINGSDETRTAARAKEPVVVN